MTATAASAAAALRVLLVDDEALARLRLQTLLGDCQAPAATVVAQAGNAVEAMQHVQHHAIDLVLLDIHMPGVDGLALAQAIGRLASPPAIVFVTAHADHALTAFELEAVDYLTKPVRLDRLQLALQKVVRRHGTAAYALTAPTATAVNAAVPQATEDVLVIQDRNRTERVPLGEVLYFKAELKYVTVRTQRHSYVLDTSLNELEEKYASRFLRIHRNAMVARHAARSLQKSRDAQEGDSWALRLNGVEETLLVSRRQLPAVRELLARD